MFKEPNVFENLDTVTNNFYLTLLVIIFILIHINFYIEILRE